MLWLLLLRNKSPENGAAYNNSRPFTLPLSLGGSGVWKGRGGEVLGPRSSWSGATGAGAALEALASLPPCLGLAALPSPKARPVASPCGLAPSSLQNGGPGEVRVLTRQRKFSTVVYPLPKERKRGRSGIAFYDLVLEVLSCPLLPWAKRRESGRGGAGGQWVGQKVWGWAASPGGPAFCTWLHICLKGRKEFLEKLTEKPFFARLGTSLETLNPAPV